MGESLYDGAAKSVGGAGGHNADDPKSRFTLNRCDAHIGSFAADHRVALPASDLGYVLNECGALANIFIFAGELVAQGFV